MEEQESQLTPASWSPSARKALCQGLGTRGRCTPKLRPQKPRRRSGWTDREGKSGVGDEYLEILFVSENLPEKRESRARDGRSAIFYAGGVGRVRKALLET